MRAITDDALRAEAPENDDLVVPGYRNYLIYCDESGTGGQRYYAFGSLWLPWQRRGDFAGLVREARLRHDYAHEIKWQHVNKGSLPFFLNLVAAFFEQRWLMFHCIVVRKGYVKKDLHPGGYDQAMQKHFVLLLAKKIQFFSAGCPDKAYHVRVDPLPSRYSKADQVAHKIVNAQVRQQLGLGDAVRSLITRDSKTTAGIQVSDFLLGAVMAAVQGDVTSPHKLQVMQNIALHLGWKDLRAGTYGSQWKFNIWHFWDPTAGEEREIEARPVRLALPMPTWRAGLRATS